jgi:aspartyl aminopeptidase
MLSKEIIDKSQQFAKLAVETLKTSVSPYNFVQTAKKLLNENSFTQIYEGDEWKLEVGKKYYYTRNNSAIIAFTIGKKYDPTKSCFKIIGAHTDSPSLRLAPNSYNPSHGIERYNIQVYGGALWHTWLDRDLSIAGKVIYYNEKKELTCKIIKCNEPIFFIPNCPPHLQNADERSALKINKESHLKPLIATVLYNNGLAGEEKKNDEVKLGNTLRKVITDEINKNNPNPIKDIDIVDYDLVLYDTQEPNLIGLNKEFLASGRLDNMGSSVPAVYSIINASTEELLNEQTSINVYPYLIMKK